MSNHLKTAGYSISDLERLTGITKRNIRFYIQQGLVDKPSGDRRLAEYGEDHVRQLMSAKSLREQGVSIDGIKALMSGDNKNAAAAEVPEVRFLTQVSIYPGISLVFDCASPVTAALNIADLSGKVSEFVKNTIDHKG